jgi:hypothetical protein
MQQRHPGNSQKRETSVILADVDTALESDADNNVQIGVLLTELKSTLASDAFLLLMETRFGFSRREVRRYITAAKHAAKLPTKVLPVDGLVADFLARGGEVKQLPPAKRKRERIRPKIEISFCELV